MKKVTEPTRSSLREIPEVDVRAYRRRRNPFVHRIESEGIEIVAPRSVGRPRKERPPSRASLREMPEIRGQKARRNPYLARIQRDGIVLQVGRGRPTAGTEVGETSPRSVRFPDEVWKEIARAARKKGITVHAAIRAAVIAWLRRAA
jgi:hypothetical protein